MIRLLEDRDLQMFLSNSAIKYAEDNWSAKAVQEHLRNDIESLSVEGVAIV